MARRSAMQRVAVDGIEAEPGAERVVVHQGPVDADLERARRPQRSETRITRRPTLSS